MDKQQSNTGIPLSAFISYAHEDEPLRQQLEVHLSLLRRQGLLTSWHDRQILAGNEWERDIDEHLEKAAIILLLISPDFLASDYCYGVEMQRALERHKNGEGVVIPIIIRPVDWEGAPFVHLQCLPRDARAVTEWDNQDAAFRDIAKGIRAAISQLPATSTEPQPVRIAAVTPTTASTRAPTAQSDRNRQRMLKRVHTTWIAGVLTQSLHGAALMVLGLEEKADVLDNPWRLLMQEVDQPTQLLPGGTRITEVYNATEGGLLILGQPGAGKTTLLLELTRDLLDHAQTSENAPIPVVFNLSSWAKKRLPLSDWLVEELIIRYEVPRHLGRFWVKEDQLLLLLDGLDEVESSARRECIEAINTFRQTHSDVQVIVCSRITEYLNEPTQLRLHTAVVVQPLTQEQIDGYLESAGEPAKILREALHQDADLRELATTPLMLTILLFAYRGTSPDKISEQTSLEAKREQIFASYVQHMLKRRGASKRYQFQQITHWLAYLARQMKRQNQTLFYIEQMQPDWLPAGRIQRIYTYLGVRLPGILLGILVSLMLNFLLLFFFLGPLIIAGIISFGLFGGLLGGLLSRNHAVQVVTTEVISSEKGFRRGLITRGAVILGTGVLIGVGAALITAPDLSMNAPNMRVAFGEIIGFASILLTLFIRPWIPVQSSNEATATRTSPKPRWYSFLRSQNVRNGWLTGSIMGLSLGLSIGLLRPLMTSGLDFVLRNLSSLVGILVSGVVFGLLLGLPLGLVAVLLSIVLVDRSGAIQPIERLAWSWQSLWRGLTNAKHVKNVLRFGMFIGLIVGLIGALYLGLIFLSPYGPPSYALSETLIAISSAVLSITVMYWSLFGLFQGVTGEQLNEQRRVVPNQGIYRSARNGLLFGCIGGSICLFVCSLGVVLFFVLLFGLISGLQIGPADARPTLSTTQNIDLHLLLAPGLVFAFASCLTIGLFTGWLAYIRHYILRWLLWRTASIPWNYTRFLDYAAERILLQKAGGGYIFIHRLILDYFASLEAPSPQKARAVSAISDSPPAISDTAQMGTIRQEENASPSFPSRRASYSKEKRIATLFTIVLIILALASSAGILNVVQHSPIQKAYDATATAQGAAQIAAYEATITTQYEATATAQVPVNATAEALANASPVTYPPKNTPPVLDDPIQDNSKGNSWEVDDPSQGKCTFIHLAYDINTHGFEHCFARTTDFTNFIYEVQMKIVKGDGGGITFHCDPKEQRYYYFAITQNGSYSVYDNYSYYNNFPPLAQGSSSAIHQGLNQTNLLAAVVHGSIIELYVNHQRVAVVGSSAYGHGRIGMIVTGTNNQTEVIFQNAKVWKL